MGRSFHAEEVVVMGMSPNDLDEVASTYRLSMSQQAYVISIQKQVDMGRRLQLAQQKSRLLAEVGFSMHMSLTQGCVQPHS